MNTLLAKNQTSNFSSWMYSGPESFINSGNLKYSTPHSIRISLSSANNDIVKIIKGFAGLNENWDSYNAAKPSMVAIQRAIAFVLDLKHDVYYAAPSPDGDIMLEIRNQNRSLEIEFTHNNTDTIVALEENEIVQEAVLSQTTLQAYFKWMDCPDGNCLPD